MHRVRFEQFIVFIITLAGFDVKLEICVRVNEFSMNSRATIRYVDQRTGARQMAKVSITAIHQIISKPPKSYHCLIIYAINPYEFWTCIKERNRNLKIILTNKLNNFKRYRYITPFSHSLLSFLQLK